MFRITSHYSAISEAVNTGQCSIGVHPCYLDNYEQLLVEIRQFAGHKNVLAIGECGLDNICNKDKDLQQKIFRQQVFLASEHNKPLIIHCVRAYTELVAIIGEMKPPVPIIIHGYNKNPEVATFLLKEGMFLSFGPAILNERSPAAMVLKDIPDDVFFLETDDTAIEIAEIYRAAATLRKTDMETLILQLQNNFRKIFRYSL